MADEIRPDFRITDHAPDADRDVTDELAFHHAMRERELVESGLTPEAARAAAREAFGDDERIRGDLERTGRSLVRRRQAAWLWDSLREDVRLGLRALRRSPVFAVIAVVTLALGMGGNAVVFSLVEAVLLRAPAVVSPDRLATIWTTCRRGAPRCSSSYPDFEDYRARSTQFSDIALYNRAVLTLEVGGGVEVANSEQVSANYFSLLGLVPAAGRLLQPLDDAASGDPAVVVLSHDYWQTRFGSDPQAVGSVVRVNGLPHVVVGVAAAGFDGLVLGGSPDFWTPLRALPLLYPETGADRLQSRGSRWIQGLVGRLSPGATVESARAEMLRISDQMALEDPDARGPRSVTVDPLAQRVGGGTAELSSFLGILQGVVVLTLLLACANLANLLLARASARRVEVSVRLALGVGRARLARQMLTESLLLAVMGGVVALALSLVVLRLLGGVQLPQGIAIGSTGATLNVRVLAFLGGLTVLTGLVFGGMPALIATRAEVAGILREARTGDSGTSMRVRSTLIAVQIALGVILLVGAGLFVRTLRNRLEVDLGFPADGLALITVDASLGGLPSGRTAGLADQLVASLEAVPGVQSAGAGTTVPVVAGGSGTFVTVAGYVPAPDEEMRVEYSMVSPAYLRTLGLPVVDGRDFGTSDAANATAIIDETAARLWFNGRNAVGGTVSFGDTPYRVIGVAKRTAFGGLEVGNTPFIYLVADASAFDGPFILLVRTDGDATRSLPAIRSAIRSVEPGLAIRATDTMSREIGRWLAPQRAAAWLLSGFGALALALAAIGIYGVVSYTVSRRRRDLSIRMVLGARSAGIVLHVARGMAVPAASGLAAGIVGARLLSGSVDRFMFGVNGAEPVTYIIVGAGLAIVTTVATLLPAVRAAFTSPVETLRAD